MEKMYIVIPAYNEQENVRNVIDHRWEREDGLSRVIITKVLKGVIRVCFGVNVTDANTPYRLMEAGVLQEKMFPRSSKLGKRPCTISGSLTET